MDAKELRAVITFGTDTRRETLIEILEMLRASRDICHLAEQLTEKLRNLEEHSRKDEE